jgi:hypothetical protein
VSQSTANFQLHCLLLLMPSSRQLYRTILTGGVLVYGLLSCGGAVRMQPFCRFSEELLCTALLQVPFLFSISDRPAAFMCSCTGIAYLKLQLCGGLRNLLQLGT